MTEAIARAADPDTTASSADALTLAADPTRLGHDGGLDWGSAEAGRRQRLPLDPLPEEPRTELGYARRFVTVFGEQLRFVATWSQGHQWLIWDGRRWSPDTTGQTKRWMKVIARTVTTEALSITDETSRRNAIKEAKRGESNSAVNGALSLASTEPQIVIDHEDLDADPYLLNCTNGTLDLAHRSSYDPTSPPICITKLAGAAYDARRLTAPQFARFLDPSTARRDRCAPTSPVSSVTPSSAASSSTFCRSSGATEPTARAPSSTSSSPPSATTPAWPPPACSPHGTSTPTPPKIADLFGLRLARLDETDDGRRLAEGTVKRLTGDRRQKARRMRENFWEFDASHTFVMLTNHKPLVQGADEGIWRRLRLVPFAVVIPEAERDENAPRPTDPRSSTPSSPGSSTAASPVADHKASTTPTQVVEATAAYRAESDAVGRFLSEQLPPSSPPVASNRLGPLRRLDQMVQPRKASNPAPTRPSPPPSRTEVSTPVNHEAAWCGKASDSPLTVRMTSMSSGRGAWGRVGRVAGLTAHPRGPKAANPPNPPPAGPATSCAAASPHFATTYLHHTTSNKPVDHALGNRRPAPKMTDSRTAQLLFTIPEAADALRIGRTSVYQLLDTGQLPSIKIGSRRLIVRADLEAFIDAARH